MSHRRKALPDPVVEVILTHHNPQSVRHLHPPRVSQRMRVRIANDPDPAIRHARADFLRDHGGTVPPPQDVIDYPDLSREAFHSFADDANPRVRRLALADPSLPRHLLARLATDPDPRVRRAAASHLRIDDPLLIALLADTDAEVVANAAANVVLPTTWIYQYLEDADL
jgi:HEAT repeat protein